MAETGISMPSGFGGLMRFNEEYPSKINLSPTQVIAFIAIIIIFRFMLPLFLN